MKKITTLLCLFCGFAFAGPLTLTDVEALGVQTIDQFKQQIKGEMKKYKHDKVFMAEVCIKNAEFLSQKFNQSLQGGVELKRITQKERNQKNKPETIEEQQVLQAFELLATSGVFMPKNVIQITQNGDYKYFAPIMLDESSCVSCHGTKQKIAPEIQNLLSKTYPNDKAINYERGDFRGAFVVTVKPKDFIK